MELNILNYLNWDSQFFGYSVAKIILDNDACNSLDELLSRLKSEKIRLTYFFVPISENRINKLISDKGAILVDQKTTYFKKTEKQEGYLNHIIEFQGAEINDKLIELGLQAGLFSRFRLDVNFSQKDYERLYIEWLTKSINKELALKTFIALDDSVITGITTLGVKEGVAEIGLVAVDRNFRGNGIASDLIHMAENDAYLMGFREIKVVTQLQNKIACKLYEKCNFSIESIVNVYHYWQ